MDVTWLEQLLCAGFYLLSLSSASSPSLLLYFFPYPKPFSTFPSSHLSSLIQLYSKSHILTECPEDECVRYFITALQSLAGTEHTQVDQEL